MSGILVLLRHGQSRSTLEERFTGWQDVGLTEEGREGAARHAARLLAGAGLVFDEAFSSCLSRAVSTLRIVLSEMGQAQVPVRASWRLNERHYGALQGLEKAEAEARYGDEQVRAWKRGYRFRPPAAESSGSGHPDHDERPKHPPVEPSPLTESLEDVSKRVLPYWFDTISPSATGGRQAIVVAHGNSLRALVKHLDGLSDDEVEDLEIPPAYPLVYELDDGANPIRSYRLGEAD